MLDRSKRIVALPDGWSYVSLNDRGKKRKNTVSHADVFPKKSRKFVQEVTCFCGHIFIFELLFLIDE
jgi:hypothetical protein